MRTVAKLTGVNPITLRAWERRYGLIKPIRTEKGHRLYRQQDIEDIQRITAMLELGVSIGQVPAMLEHAPRSEPLARPLDTADGHEKTTEASARHGCKTTVAHCPILTSPRCMPWKPTRLG